MATENKRMAARSNGDILTVLEVADLLQLSQATIRRKFDDHTIPAKKIGTKWRCLRSELDKFFQTT